MGKSAKKHQHSSSQPKKPQPQMPASPKESPNDSPKEQGAWVRRKITAELKSDAHLGSGVGGQGLHALLARDRLGRPVIWSSHLEGLLREAARAQKQAAATAPDAQKQADAESLFGKAGGSRQQMVFTSLYLEKDKDAPQSRVWRSTARVSLDERKTVINRAPDPDTLRAIEFVPKGTKFVGEVELPETDVGILERLLQEVESIGHGRASGAGLVKFILSAAPVESSVSFQIQQPRLRLLLRNRDPLCIAKTATPGNIIPTQPYIPGRTLLGALAAWLIAEGTEEAKQAAELLVNGTVSVSDALPLKAETSLDKLGPVDVLPAPLSLQSQKPKGQVGNVPWWAREKSPTIYLDKHQQDLDEDRQQKDQDKPDKGKQKEKLKRPEPDLFVQQIGPGPWETHRPDIRIRLRNGRPNLGDKDPSLFAIEQIAEDTQFLTELRGKAEDMQKLCAALAPILTKKRWLRIGRGGVPVQVEKAAPLTIEKPPAPQGNAYLILTSDLLFRDDQLRWQTRMTPSNLKDLPGWPKGFCEKLTEEIFKPILQEETEIRGFNGTSGLWRLPSVAIRRGSVFKVNAALASELRKLASQGLWLGVRTHEGFGRFRIDDEDTLPGVPPDLKEGANPTKGVDPTKGAGPEKGAGTCKTRAGRPDDASEQVACMTKNWKDKYVGKETLVQMDEPTSEPKPSLSQWQDLVTELELRKLDALTKRLDPKTAGAAGWKHPTAARVLTTLIRMTDLTKRAEYARMFVRWLRAKAKQKDSGTKEKKQEVAG